MNKWMTCAQFSFGLCSRKWKHLDRTWMGSGCIDWNTLFTQWKEECIQQQHWFRSVLGKGWEWNINLFRMRKAVISPSVERNNYYQTNQEETLLDHLSWNWLTNNDQDDIRMHLLPLVQIPSYLLTDRHRRRQSCRSSIYTTEGGNDILLFIVFGPGGWNREAAAAPAAAEVGGQGKIGSNLRATNNPFEGLTEEDTSAG